VFYCIKLELIVLYLYMN